MPSNWLLFDRIRALTKQYNIYQAERIYQDQPSLDRLASGSEFDNFSAQEAILDQTNLQINRFERYKDYEQMDQTGEVSLALDLYADEGCLTGDTVVPLLDGTFPTIAELSNRTDNYWVYAFDQKSNKYVPALARNARVTLENVPILKITLDDGCVIKATSNHLFMLNDGSFIEAGDLKAGDSLKPLYKKIRYRNKNGRALFDEKPYPSATGYEYFFNGKNFTTTHRWVYHHFNDDSPEIVHHADFRSLNNSPDNLHGMTDAEHNAIHCKYGSSDNSFNPMTFDDILNAVADWHGPMTKDLLGEALDVGERVLNRIFKENNVIWSEFKRQCHRCSSCDSKLVGDGWVCQSCRKNYLRHYHQKKKQQEEYRERRNKNKRDSYILHEAVRVKSCRACKQSKDISQFKRNNSAYGPYCNDCRPTNCQSRYLDKSFGNHSVVSVEQCGIADKVYDLEVPQYHCFAAGSDSSWVIVHNSLVDPERKHTLVIRARNRRLKTELEQLFFKTLLWDSQCRPAIRYLCKYGDMPFEIVTSDHRDRVTALRNINVYNFTRVETKHGDLVGFYHQEENISAPQYMHPWQVAHMRLTNYENIYAPYGKSILDGGRKAFKQLRLMEDAALIYRITRAPEKRKFTIPIGLIPAKEVPEYMASIARTFKRQRFYNPTTGTFDERYSPLIQEDDFFLPRRPDGSGPDIDTRPGAENLDQIADIEYFKKKMISPLKIPFERVGLGEGGGQASEKSLSQSHAEFAKAVQWVQREVSVALTKVAIVHLALRGYSVDDLTGFDVSLSSTSAMEELYRIETWRTRSSVMAELKDLGWFPKEWIVTRFTDMSMDEIQELKEMEVIESEGGSGGGMPGGFDLGGGFEEDLGGETEGAADIEGLGGEEPLAAEEAEAGADEELQALTPEAEIPEGIAAFGRTSEAEKNILLEQQRLDKIARKEKILNKWQLRKNPSAASQDNYPNNTFHNLLESHDLDGLTTYQDDKEQVLIECTIEEEVRREVIAEVEELLKLQEFESSNDQEVDVDDLPIV